MWQDILVYVAVAGVTAWTVWTLLPPRAARSEMHRLAGRPSGSTSRAGCPKCSHCGACNDRPSQPQH